MKKIVSCYMLSLKKYYKFYFIAIIPFYLSSTFSFATPFTDIITDENWQQFINSHSDKINLDYEIDQLSAITLAPLTQEDLFKQKTYSYLFDQLKEIYINNPSVSQTSQTIAIQLRPSLELGDQKQTDKTISDVKLNLANNTKIDINAQQGQAIGIQAKLNFQFLRSKEVEEDIKLNQLVEVGDNNQLSIINKHGSALAWDISNNIEFNENMPDTQPAIIYKDIAAQSEIIIGKNNQINITSFDNATAIKMLNQINTIKSIPVMNRNMHHIESSTLLLGDHNIINVASNTGDAIAIDGQAILNYEELTSILSAPFPKLQNIEQTSTVDIGSSTMINVDASQGNAIGITLKNSQNYTGQDIAGLDFSISNNQFLSQITTQQDVTISTNAAKQAIGLLLTDQFDNQNSVSDRFGDKISSEVKLKLGERNRIYTNAVEFESCAVKLINQSHILPKESDDEYQGTSQVSAEIGKDSQLISQSEQGKSYGLFINNKATLEPAKVAEIKRYATLNATLADNVAISSTGAQQAYGIYIDVNDNATQLNPNSQQQLATSLHLLGDLDIYSFSSTPNEAYAAYLEGKGSTLSSDNPGRYRFTGRLVAKDQAVIALNAKADSLMISNLMADNAFINLSMTENSRLVGSSQLDINSIINLVLDHHADWFITDDSFLSSLTLNDQTNVYLSKNKAIYDDPTLPARFNKLIVDSLSGNGNLWMNADLSNADKNITNIDESTMFKDFLYITSQLNGNYIITIPNQANYQGDASNIVLIRSDDINSTGNFSMADNIEIGGYIYKLKKISQSAAQCHNSQGCNYWALSGTKKPSTTVRATVNSINAGYLLTYAETQTSLQRLGQLRNTKKYQGDIWVHSFSGGMNAFDAYPMLDQTHLTYRGFQLGTDKQFHPLNKVNYAGILMGLSTANLSYRLGDGSLRNWHVGLYDTLIFDNMFYIDFLAKYTRMTHHYKIKDSLGKNVTGKAHTQGMVSALSVGMQIPVYDYLPHIEGFYIEPQAQLSVAYNGSSSYRASNGLQISVDDYTSTLGKLSTTLGYHKENSLTPMNGYITLAYLNEMSAKTDFNFNNRRHTQKFTGTWYTLAIGMNTEIRKQHALYIDMERSEGNRFNDHKINAGYRFSF